MEDKIAGYVVALQVDLSDGRWLKTWSDRVYRNPAEASDELRDANDGRSTEPFKIYGLLEMEQL